MFTTFKKNVKPNKNWKKDMKNYKKNCWENREKLEKINRKIKKHEIIERINKKEKQELEIPHETKALEEIKTNLKS